MMSRGISYISNAFEKQEIKGRSPKLYVLLRLLQQHFWNGGKSAFVAIKNISTCVQHKDVEKEDFSTTHKKFCYKTDYQTFQSRLCETYLTQMSNFISTTF